MSKLTSNATYSPTASLKNQPKLAALAIITTLVTACGGGSSSSGSSEPGLGAALTATIEGSWQSECYVVGDMLSARDQLEFDGINYQQLTLFFAASEDCGGQLNFLLTSDGNYVLPGATTQTGTRLAEHININITDIQSTATPALEAFLAIDNNTVADFASQQLGLTNLQNLQPQDLGISSPYFSLVAIEDGRLYVGDRESNSGDSAETRLTELSTDPRGNFSRI